MSLSSVIGRGRAVAERQMLDTCQVRRQTGVQTDQLTGATTPVYETVYPLPGGDGRCKVQQSTASGQRAEAGEASVVVMRREVHLPVLASPAIRRGDEVVVSVCALDPDVVGRVLRVHDEAGKTAATARRLGVEEVT